MKWIRKITVLLLLLSLTAIPCAAWSYVTIKYTDYDEYKEKIEKLEFPENVILYDAISDLGEFVQFEHSPIDLKTYTYRLSDANKVQLALKIEHDEEIAEISVGNRQKLSWDDVTDLRIHPSGQSGYLDVGGCVYTYASGKLEYIKWISKGVAFQLSFEEPTEDNVSKNSTLLCDLLTPSTAEDATKKLEQITVRNWFVHHLWIIIVAVVLVVLIVAAIVIIKFARAKKKESSAN